MARPATISQPTSWGVTPHFHTQAEILGLTAAIPSGVIVMWGGLLSAIPAGWRLCDGTGGTPDLRGRFIKGTAQGMDPGGIGGSTTHAHTTGTYAVSAHVGAAVDAHTGVTVSAHTGTAVDVHSGVTVGNHAYTPSGTNSAPTFAGAALGTHAHELPMQLVGGTSTRHLAATVFGTGTSRAAQGAVTQIANTTSAAVALSQAVSAGTPTGTVSAPTFTGQAATLTHTVTQPNAHIVTQPSNHTVTQPNNHVVTQPSNHTLSGGSDTVNHEPTYYTLAFIQKT